MLIVPDVIREAQQSPPHPPRQYPPKVRDAFVVLGIESTDDMQTIKKTYRDMVGQYHPDKVAHLGKELRHLAEEKTKTLVMAFQVIEIYLQE
jgi:DnaJ-domain-containing protein 1